MTISETASCKPVELLAELTHRCPLGCPYCSNPLALEPQDGELDSGTWARVFGEAAALGALDVQLSGGEPGLRRDLVDITAHAREAGLRTSLVTSGVGITTRTMRDLWEAGLDHVQVSFQDADAVSADRIAGHRSAFQRKAALAAEAVRIGLPLTVSMVMHRANIGRIAALAELALKLGAARMQIAAMQYVGWAQKNRRALMPTGEEIRRARAETVELQGRLRDRIVIDASELDDRAHESRAGAPGSITVTPSGRVLPYPAAASALGLEFWNVRERSLADIWARSPAFEVVRKTGGPQVSSGDSEADSAAVQEDAPYVYRAQ